MSCDRQQTDGDSHVDHGLYHDEEAQPKSHQRAEAERTFAHNPDDTREKDNIEQEYDDASHNAVFFDDDGIDEVGVGMRQEVTLFALARAFAKHRTRSHCNVGVGALHVLIVEAVDFALVFTHRFQTV